MEPSPPPDLTRPTYSTCDLCGVFLPSRDLRRHLIESHLLEGRLPALHSVGGGSRSTEGGDEEDARVNLRPMSEAEKAATPADDLCPICLVPLRECEGPVVRVPGCGHPFCRACISRWLETPTTGSIGRSGGQRHCPVCKTELLPVEEEKRPSSALIVQSVVLRNVIIWHYDVGEVDGDEDDEDDEEEDEDDDWAEAVMMADMTLGG
jgi:hypothetical protein